MGEDSMEVLMNDNSAKATMVEDSAEVLMNDNSSKAVIVTDSAEPDICQDKHVLSLFDTFKIVSSETHLRINDINNNPVEEDTTYKVQQTQTEEELPNVPSYTRGIPDEQRLMLYLFNGYERTVRPVRNASTPVVIRMGLTLTQIFDMDEKNQVLVTNVWLDQEWEDEFLIWNPKEFANISTIRIPCNKLWLPDIVLYNNAAEYTDGLMPANAMVRHDGNVFWPIPTKLQSSCKVDVTYFPFDMQTCRMKFGSWTYDGFQVDITNRTEEVDLSNYVNNGEWELMSIKPVRNVVTYACCDEPFPDVTFTIHIRRRTLYYMYNVIFPCIMMSALTLLVFCLPPDSGEKIALGITVLLAFSVFMLAVAENLPETSEFVPLISIYLTIVMALTSMSVMMTVLVLNLHHRGPNKHTVPHWLKVILLHKLSPYLCLQEENNDIVRFIDTEEKFIKNMSLKITLDNIQQALQNEIQIENSQQAQNNINIRHQPVQPDPQTTNSPILEHPAFQSANHVYNRTLNAPAEQPPRQQCYHSYDTQTNEYKIHTSNKTVQITQDSARDQTKQQTPSHSQSENNRRNKRRANSNLGKTNEEILNSLKRILEKHEKEDRDYEIIQEWRRVAQCVDRILFFIFLIATVSSTLGILVIAPATQ
ncbi:neuronal acetylcholine receptor subunit alpha-7-like [Mercenaria mercenaria]|uniref:neuronal acetylcholine receptor subunit alpha-7-like n=1 Tax=Mercenaria mercenaria TaxID=6596 RepID=UPI00234E40E5|nr:neuronal acetylcholine receptor subunit alpha-7-like [Mercenaria mercenaria]